MTSSEDLLEIDLEDVAGTSWWAGLLTTLSSQAGNQTLRFVGRVDGTSRYRGETFSSPRAINPVDPSEEWAPGMKDSLLVLRREIEADGWVETGHGPKFWEFAYARTATP